MRIFSCMRFYINASIYLRMDNKELGLMMPDVDGPSALKMAWVMFVAFVAFGFVPLLGYCILSPFDWNGQFDPRFLVTCLLSGLALFALGALKRYTLSCATETRLHLILN